MKLTELKKRIYCIAEVLSEQEISNCGENTHQKDEKHKQSKDQCFFLFEESLYYQGTHSTQQEMDSLIQKI